MDVFKNIKLLLLKIRFRAKNRHNGLTVANVFDIGKVSVGRGTYGSIYVLSFNDENRLAIGNYCSISPGVSFLLSADHYTNHISTFPFKAKVFGEKYEAVSKGDIIVDDDVWIGFGATILSGVHISQGAIVAAGAVVTKDVPPYAIVGGIPAALIRYRFEPEMIEELMKVDFSKMTRDDMKNHLDELYRKLEDKKQLEWLQNM